MSILGKFLREYWNQLGNKVNGGFITTEERVIEIRGLLTEQAYTPVIPQQPTLEEKVTLLEKENTELKHAIAEITMMIATP